MTCRHERLSVVSGECIDCGAPARTMLLDARKRIAELEAALSGTVGRARLDPEGTAQPNRKLPWLRCQHCGLLTLRNALTQ